MQLSAIPHWSHLHQHDCNDRIRSIQVLPNRYFCWLRCSRHSYLFIPTDKMKFSYHEVVVSNSRRLDESGDLNSHDGRCSSSTTRFRHPLAQITSEFRNLIFPDVEKIGITFLIFRLFLRRLLLIALLLDPLNFVLARTRLRKFVFTWGNIWKWNIVRCRIFIPRIGRILPMSSMLIASLH